MENMLQFSMVVLVDDRLGGAGVCWLAELAFCEFGEGNVEAGAEGIRNAQLDDSWVSFDGSTCGEAEHTMTHDRRKSVPKTAMSM